MSAESLLRGVIGDDSPEVLEFVLDSLRTAAEEADGAILEEAIALLEAHQVTEHSLDALREVALSAMQAASALPAAAAEAPAPPSLHQLSQSPQAAARGPPAAAQAGSSDGAEADTAAETAACAQLHELVPEASVELCRYLLRLCGGRSNDAVEQLLTDRDAGRLEEREAERLEAEAAERAAADQLKEDERNARRRALERNDLVRDYRADNSKLEVAPPRLPYGQSRKAALGGTRYLDGQVVAYKGEKKVAVSQPEEWDGGSRGRVNTKGKRGPGFV